MLLKSYPHVNPQIISKVSHIKKQALGYKRENQRRVPSLFVCLFVCFWFFPDRVSLCNPGCPGTHSVEKADLELRNPHASASQVLGLKVCVTTARRVPSGEIKCDGGHTAGEAAAYISHPGCCPQIT